MRLYLTTLLFLPFTLAVSIAGQYRLGIMNDASKCFLTCHEMAVTFITLPGKDINFGAAIGLNCAYDRWVTLISTCLPYTCVSAADLGYALEYGKGYCARAGVDDVNITLPQWFLESEGGQWYQNTLAASSATSHGGTWAAPAAVAVAAAAMLLL